MNIKTITCHDVYNCGASLQTYALQTYLTSLGHQVEIIDYKPDYLSGHYNLWSVSNPKWDKPLFKQLYLLLKLPGRLLGLKRKKKFDCFRETYLKLTPNKYKSYKELCDNPPIADLYIAGSDQIWNTLFQNGRDPAFYLSFVPSQKIKASYAASFATSRIAKEYQDFVSEKINGLDFVSVREQQALELLNKMNISHGKVVCDPVFLLSKEQWNALLPKKVKRESYILVYDFEKSKKIQVICQALSMQLGVKIYSVSPFALNYADKNLVHIGPLEFVSLIRDAEYIVSNSFHGNAFSLLFNKEFCIVNREEGINERMKSLLESLSIPERLVSEYNSRLLEKIDYNTVNRLLDKNTENSVHYLNEVLASLSTKK